MKSSEFIEKLKTGLKFENHGWFLSYFVISLYFFYLIKYLIFEAWEIEKSLIYFPLIILFSVFIGTFFVAVYKNATNKTIKEWGKK